MAKFKHEVLDLIRSDADLFATVSKVLGIKPVSLLKSIDRNGASLNQFHVVKAVAKYLGKKPDELLEEELTGQQS